MPLSKTYSGLYEFFSGDLYATVELKESGEGWVSEWWVSRNLMGDLGVQLLGCLRLPVFGDTEEDAERRIGFIYEDVMGFARDIAGGYGSVGAGNDVKNSRIHCKSHLQVWSDIGMHSYNKTALTASLYSLAIDFGVNNPAALIAEVEAVGVRAIHERIAYARRIGLLDSYGKGRTKPSLDSVSLDVVNSNTEEKDIYSGSGPKGYRIYKDGVWYDHTE